ncbi:YhcH/YjgK/YiaL family protein [Salidesulfovibrio onnuriiensis]|uniref:YhcH/YjgK/YiaL family protein n=1 Tax=Salidesulfovibrio onnuriiensis TaxID=2583823 RepID=UPI0011CC91B3|nr:YhcH/YjgK/YiaL family protein [Salidesulfovibrio onnuriiensis]
MIIDILENAARYEALNPGFAVAFEFLRRADLGGLAEGRHDIEGDLFAVVAHGPGRDRREAPLEVHRKYIDIQYVVSGSDEMGWKPAATCGRVSVPFDADKDVGFFTDTPDLWAPVRPGMFAIFFPWDAHQPMTGHGEIRKVIVKVPA